MGWFSSSSSPTPAQPAAVTQPSTPDNLARDVKTASAGEKTEKVKPCCVCKDEKSRRDECMLFSRADDPQEDCKSLVMQYKDCMAGYGFKI
ncbi:Cytochrome c oxidase copper chaperone [Fonsecaea pedrosoi]|nr:Cytochrome c oxidase copper chaperone [Fonsecaea pedrosoi]